MGKDCIMHGYMSKLGNPFLTQWQRRYFYLFPNRLEWRGEGESPVRRARGGTGRCWGEQGVHLGTGRHRGGTWGEGCAEADVALQRVWGHMGGFGGPRWGRGLSLSPQQSLLTMEEIDSVEETQVKERKCILLRIRGGKQFVLQCDVSVPWATCRGWPPSPAVTGHSCQALATSLAMSPGCQVLLLGTNLHFSHLLLAGY